MTGHHSIAGIRLVLGGNVLGWTADRDASFAVLDKFYEAGGRMVDSAQGYSVWADGHVGGESEAMIGQWLDARGVRSEMRIATKTGMFGKPGDLDPAKLAQELDKSLERLRTDYVDLYYAHRDEEQTPQDEVADGFDQLFKAGKVREIGASNFDAKRLRSAIAAAETRNLVPYTVLQNEYNLVTRDSYEGEIQDLCIERGIAMLPWFGLCAGFLTGKYRSRADLEKYARGSSVERYIDKGLSLLPVLDQVVAETGASHAAVSLAWLNAQPGIAAPIASARVPEQLDQLLEAMTVKLNDDQLQRLAEAAPS